MQVIVGKTCPYTRCGKGEGENCCVVGGDGSVLHRGEEGVSVQAMWTCSGEYIVASVTNRGIKNHILLYQCGDRLIKEIIE